MTRGACSGGNAAIRHTIYGSQLLKDAVCDQLREATGERPVIRPERPDVLLHLHVEAVLQLCHAALPPMLAAGAGDIINVSSVAGFFPMSGGPTYAAEKAFVTALSQGLAAQYAERGVRVMALCPGFTRTEFHERAGLPIEGIPRRLWLRSDQVAAEALKDLRRGRPVSVPGLAYKGLVATGRYVPPPLLRALSGAARRRRGRP